MGATREELLDLANFWEERGDLQEANRLRVSAGEVRMYALYAVSVGSVGYSSPDMVGEPSEDRAALEQRGKELGRKADLEGRYGTAYWVYQVKQQTIWVRI